VKSKDRALLISLIKKSVDIKPKEHGVIRLNDYDFINDMGWFYGQVDIMISRAGASTISELVKYGKGSVFIPFPFAANNHQEKNARFIEKNGGGYVVLEEELNKGKLFEILDELIKSPEKVAEMNENIKRLYNGDATETVIKNIKENLDKVCLEK
jgi:UDP-N-acetylglucosamine--N-acetylmuramyl-(pentapeptide) pyrophosphoryl-undecaprenol N-acetylglucosamine transferase